MAILNQCLRIGDIGYMNEFPDFRSPQFDIDTYNRRFHEANVIIDATSSQIYYPEHWGGLSVKCAFHGAEYYKCPNGLYKVDDSAFLIFNEGKFYSSWIDEVARVESFTINFSPSFERHATVALLSSNEVLLNDPYRKESNRIHFLECLYPHGGQISELMMNMRQLAKNASATHQRLEEMFFELFASMKHLQDRSFPSALTNTTRAPARIELHQRLLRARDFMMSTYKENINLSQVAHIACLNKFHFLRQFKNTFGLTPHQFLTRRRLELASEKLRNTTQSISSICTEVGFTDLASFSKLFRRTTGASPVSYRKGLGLLTPTESQFSPNRG